MSGTPDFATVRVPGELSEYADLYRQGYELGWKEQRYEPVQENIRHSFPHPGASQAAGAVQAGWQAGGEARVQYIAEWRAKHPEDPESLPDGV